MRFLHTSDWHVGKTLKGRSRLEEQEQVLREVVAIAREHEVDAVLVAGDLYDTSAPSAEAQRLVVRTLVGLRRTGAEVLAMSGNHDHAPTFDAYRLVTEAAGVTMMGRPRSRQDGGVVTFTARSTGERVNVGVLPFVSQRFAVRAAELVTRTPAENTAGYEQLVREILAELREGFTDDAVNVVMAHLTVVNGLFGGGERTAQSIFEYAVHASAFPEDAHYVALGHLHRRQTLPAPAPVVYCGAPFAVDFGEEENPSVVCVVEATPTTPARVTDVPVTSARRLRTLRGTLEELVALAPEVGDDLLRVYVREPARAGLREQVQELLPGALEVRIDPDFAAARSERPAPGPRVERSPAQLFGEYCASRQVVDPRVEALFASLHDAATGGEA